MDDMVRKADNVVLAVALDNQVRIDPASRWHYTVTTFEVIEAATGGALPGELIEVEIIGGASEGYATTVADAPRFAIGEAVILFTSPGTGDGPKNLVGFYQGAVRLLQDPESTEPGTGALVVVAPPPETLSVRIAGVAGTPSLAHMSNRPAPVGVVVPPPPASAAAGAAQLEPKQAKVRATDLLARVRAMAETAAAEEEGR
jgi:hypothetical protein